jgi:hypothetical protein
MIIVNMQKIASRQMQIPPFVVIFAIRIQAGEQQSNEDNP